jgi:hypothetical protein
MGSLLDEGRLPVTAVACAGCGWTVHGGTAGCRARFEALLARDFADSRFFAVHRTFVDCYSLQHPDDYCVSAKSLAAHLVGLAQIIDGAAGAATGSPELRRWLDGNRALEKPPLPTDRGAITLGDIEGIEDPAEWREAVRGWVQSIWSAYGDLHGVARNWATEAGRSGGKR